MSIEWFFAREHFRSLCYRRESRRADHVARSDCSTFPQVFRENPVNRASCQCQIFNNAAINVFTLFFYSPRAGRASLHIAQLNKPAYIHETL